MSPMPYFFRPFLPAALLMGLSMSFSRTALADDSVAETLYQEGRRAASAKDWELACRKFRESHDREPAPGTLLNLADCEEKRGLLTEAMAHFEAASRLFRDERGPFAKERAIAIEKRLPRLTLRLEPTSPTDTTVERDGRMLHAGALGTPAALDPGDHVVIVRASGRVEAKRTIRLAEKENRDVELVAGPPLPNASTGAAAAGTPGIEPHAAPSEHERGSSLRTAGIVSLGVGALGLVVGVVSGIVVLNSKSTADANCQPTCTDVGLDAQRQGRTMSIVSTAGFVTAGVGLITGGVLLLLPSSRGRTSALGATPVPGGSLVGWTGTF